jgi:hypothetical protein
MFIKSTLLHKRDAPQYITHMKLRTSYAHLHSCGGCANSRALLPARIHSRYTDAPLAVTISSQPTYQSMMRRSLPLCCAAPRTAGATGGSAGGGGSVSLRHAAAGGRQSACAGALAAVPRRHASQALLDVLPAAGPGGLVTRAALHAAAHAGCLRWGGEKL